MDYDSFTSRQVKNPHLTAIRQFGALKANKHTSKLPLSFSHSHSSIHFILSIASLLFGIKFFSFVGTIKLLLLENYYNQIIKYQKLFVTKLSYCHLRTFIAAISLFWKCSTKNKGRHIGSVVVWLVRLLLMLKAVSFFYYWIYLQ